MACLHAPYEWSEWLAAGFHSRSRWRLPLLITSLMFGGGRLASLAESTGVFPFSLHSLGPLTELAGFSLRTPPVIRAGTTQR